jgi:hypothetical protein
MTTMHETKDNCAGEGQQQITDLLRAVVNNQLPVRDERSRYQTKSMWLREDMADWEDSVCYSV